MKTCECRCREGEPYADGALPLFYSAAEQAKAIYSFKKLSRRCVTGSERSQKEFILLCCDAAELLGAAPYQTTCVTHGKSTGRWQMKPLDSLKEYGLYFGVHVDGRHLLAVD